MLNRTIASAASTPFLVAPNDRASTPAFHVISAGEQPSDTRALAKRDPSICNPREEDLQTSPMAAISSRV
ncbi:hypothetical protein D9M73_205800 [compost metagenome]